MDRKYGSRAAGWSVLENHCCKSGDVVLTTKNGSPTATTRTSSTPAMGFPPPTMKLRLMTSGPTAAKSSTGSSRTARCSPAWRRTPSQRVVAWA